MSIHKLRAVEDARLITIDLDAPRLVIARSDRYAFAVNQGAMLCTACDPKGNVYCHRHLQPALARARCTRALIEEVVRAAFNNQLDARDGRIWAAWQEALIEIDEEPADVGRSVGTAFEITAAHARWLQKLLDKEDLRLKAGLAQWREALSEYLSAVITAEPYEPQRDRAPAKETVTVAPDASWHQE